MWTFQIIALMACNQDMREVVGETMVESVLIVLQVF
jgi:hypothetical protein